MIETIKQLIRLQAVDSAIMAASERKNKGPEQIKELEEELGRLRSELEEQRQRAQDLADKRKEAEQDLEQIRNKIRKSQAKLSLVKNNREYRATLKEIDDLKAMMKAKEEDILNIMEEQEGLEKSLKEREELLEKERVRVEEKIKEIREVMSQAEEELGKYRERKELLSQGLDKATLDRYNFIRENRGGLALAGVTNGVCTVCNMNLPPQHFNDLLKSDRLLTCPNCHRIIYWMDHEELKEGSGEGTDPL